MKAENFILEIGTEELPASFIEPALKSIKEQFKKILLDSKLSTESLEIFGTPRRLILIASGIPTKQPDREEIITGPAWKAAFDENGNPTRAAEGFARSKGVSAKELIKIETEKGIYAGIKRTIKGKETRNILSEKIPELIRSIPFKKSMRWGNGNLRFGRPIRWICAIFGKETVPFSIDGIESSNLSRGHRFLSPEPFDVSEVDDFISELESRYVVADVQKRKSLILDGAKDLAEKAGCVLIDDEDLLEEVTNLVEFPYPMLGSFEERFLQLPEEVPIVVMKEHQRYFSVKDKNGKLKNYFIAVANIKPPEEELIRHGYEKVLRARLSDALFFFNEDRKRKLEERVPELKGVIFHDKLGTMFEKVERLQKLTPKIAELIEGNSEKAERAAFLSKADLVTEMVKEFTELQGVMGKNYALLDGEDREVAEAIFEQYLPRFSDDQTAKTKTGIALSLAEKFDNIVGFFGVGLKPTGSMDPFALRRNAIGIIKTLTENGILIDIMEIATLAFNIYESQGKKLSESNPEDVVNFIKERLKTLLSEKFRQDTIDAVLDVTNNITDAVERIRAIDELRKDEEFETVLLTMRRVMNIIPPDFHATSNEIETDNEYERQLLEAFKTIKEEIEKDIKRGDYKSALLRIGSLKRNVDLFFDNVMVMDKNEEIKHRRLSILKLISETLSQFANFRNIRS
ncbi:glycine--tRNA ligase subunit beta [Desulfurobacterium indicum]|uniref:Glycine--tRNA ligase beta subunit n=1 Tax=Desulfurobacterium indicum TaxID=1914305 RepID=A0A1R1ML97_9BACT|nr:glycine--tRNA ligase subunit beta [Desulfurobacterium indicum]OMH40577.1 glycine--tRNA ligase subunit beta [Desulfurobacterium indicum]